MPHEEVGRFLSKALDEPLGRIRYNQLILLFGCLGSIIYLFLIGIGLKKNKERKRVVGCYLLITFFLIAITINILMVVNIEMIHFVQYALLIILLFPIFLNFGISLFLTVLLGALDEAHQYWILTPLSTDYYDFNDVNINLLGAALGILLLYANGYSNEPKIRRWYQSIITVYTAFIILIASFFYLTGILNIYPTEGIIQAPLLLVREIQTDFWTMDGPNVKFHVLRPFWGVLISVLLFHFYYRIEGFFIKEKPKIQL